MPFPSQIPVPYDVSVLQCTVGASFISRYKQPKNNSFRDSWMNCYFIGKYTKYLCPKYNLLLISEKRPRHELKSATFTTHISHIENRIQIKFLNNSSVIYFRLKMWVEFWSELSFSCVSYYVSYLFPVLFKLPRFWGLKIENQILFSTGQYPYKDHATFSSVLSTTILEYKTRTHCNHLDKSFIMEKTSFDRVRELAFKKYLIFGSH